MSRRLALLITPFALALLCPSQARAEGNNSQPGSAISDATVPAVAIAIGADLLAAGDHRRQETGRRVLDAALWSSILRKPIQGAIRSARPAPFDYDHHAFPSGHTTTAFAVAAALSEREPSAAPWAYAAAAAVGWSRHQVGMHTWEQIIAGAALGAYVGMRCGKGQWRAFGHTDAQEAEGTESAAFAADEPLLTGPDPPLPGVSGDEGLEMSLTLWSTRF
jgi:membrane-associated phospholipid phosphatase